LERARESQGDLKEPIFDLVAIKLSALCWPEIVALVEAVEDMDTRSMLVGTAPSKRFVMDAFDALNAKAGEL
jgi:hypothetical protein